MKTSSLLEAIPHLVMVTNENALARYVNRRWLGYTGLKWEQAQGLGWLAAVHPYDCPQVWQSDKLNTLPQPHAFEIEYRLRRHDGVYLWFLQCNEPLLEIIEGVEQFRGWVCAVTEIDQRKRTRDTLEYLYQTTPNGVLYQDATGQITDANPAAQQILGLSLEQLQGRTSFDPQWHSVREDGSSLPGEQHPSMLALATGKPIMETIMGLHNPSLNQTRWITINAIPQFQPGEDRPYQVHSHFEDITESKQANLERERLLEQVAFERTRLETVLAQMPPGVIVADANSGRISLVNNQIERIFNIPFTPGMTLERTFSLTFHPNGERLKRNEFPLNRALEGQTVSSEELEIQRPDGSRAIVLASAVPIHDRLGKIVAAVFTCEDLTERRRTEAEVQRLTRSIQSAREALTLHGGRPVTPERFVELMGELYGKLGQSQLEGGLVALLLLQAEPMSLGKAAKMLGVSKVAISKVSNTMLERGDLLISKAFSSREHLLALTNHSYIRDLSVRRMASWAISILCDAMLEANHLDVAVTEQIRTHLETHTRVAVALEQVLSPLEQGQARSLSTHFLENWDAVQPKDSPQKPE